MAKLIVEFIGAFFLALTIGLNVLRPTEGSEQFAPLAIGAVLMVLTFAGGHVSGAHFNPAVSLGAWFRGKLKSTELPGYMVAQVLGAAVASFVVLYFKGESGSAAVDSLDAADRAFDAGRVILAEFLFTFLLVFVILDVTTAKGTAGNSFYGLAIGFTVLAGHYSVYAISGAAFNPAVAVSACLLKLSSWTTLWAYFAPQFLAGLAAAAVFKAVHPNRD